MATIPLTSRIDHDGQDWPVIVHVGLTGAVGLHLPDTAPVALIVAGMAADGLIRRGFPLDALNHLPADMHPLTLALLRVARTMELAGAGIVAHALGLRANPVREVAA
jgi:hypothetical protein